MDDARVKTLERDVTALLWFISEKNADAAQVKAMDDFEPYRRDIYGTMLILARVEYSEHIKKREATRERSVHMDTKETEPVKFANWDVIEDPQLFIGKSLMEKHPELKAITVDGTIYILDVTEGCIGLPVADGNPATVAQN